MKKIKFYNIIVVFSLVISTASYGQEQTITLSTNHSGATHDKVARDAVILDEGFIFDATGGSYTFTARTDETLICDVDYLTGSDTVNNDQRTILTSYDVGATPGAFSVNSYGAANYAVPIYTPPGIKGMQPNVSIGYNSSSNSGILGVGWNLGAVSAISRVSRDYVHDSETEGIELNYDDKFALDGNRLVLKSGTYGYASSTYETEYKNFSTITAVGTSGNGPTSFQVTTVDGRTLLYGNVTESRDVIGSTAYVWRLTKVTDANGNYMEYVYKKSTLGETYLETIKYTGNSVAGTDPLNEIKFVYEEKDDKNFYYLRGNKLERNLILRRIRVKSGDISYRVYDFGYIEANSTTFLHKITESNKDGEEYNATTINWNNLPSEQFSSMSSSMDPTKYTGDFNGDGLTDYLELQPDLDVDVFYNDGDGTFTNETAYSIGYQQILIGAVVADFNGDGKEDIASITLDTCSWNYVGHTWEKETCEDYRFTFYQNTNGNFIYKSEFETNYCDTYCGDITKRAPDPLDSEFDHKILPGDFNGDGYNDVIVFNNLYLGASNMANMAEAQGIGYEDFNYVIDIDGDGKSEFVTFDGSEIEVHAFNGSSMDIATQFNLSTDGENLYFGDFNGDGQSDLLYFASSDWKIRYGAGNSFATAVDAPITSTTDPSASDYDYLYYTGDVDGNGKDDILELYTSGSSKYIRVFYSNGNNSFTSYNNLLTDESFDRDVTTLANLTKDGQLDIILEDNGKIYSFYPFNYSRKMKSVMDGTGIKTAISYRRLTEMDDDLYLQNATESFPLNVYTIPATVVSSYVQTSTFNTDVEIANVSLAYENAVLHTQGLGFLGYKKVTYTNTNGNKTVNEFAFDLPRNTPYMVKSQAYYKNALLSTNDITKGYKEFNLAGGKNYFFYTSTAEATDELNGNTTTTVNTYDANANLTKTKTTSEDGSYTESLPSNYVANGSYHPGQVITNTKHKDDASVFSTTTKYAYNSDHNLTQVIENFGKSNQVTTNYTSTEINSYGYPTEIQQIPTGMNTITTTLSYDGTKRFVASKGISNLGTEYFTYDALGNVLTSEDMYGNSVENAYDGWGNLTGSTDNFSNTSEVTLGWGSTSDPVGTILTREVTSPTAPSSKEYVDFAGRTVRAKSEGFNSIYYYSDAEYNNRNLVSKQSNTYQQGGTVNWNTYSYNTNTDGRLLGISYHSGASLGYTYGTNTVTESVNSKNYVTEYDAAGNIESITNPLSSVVGYDYYSSGVTSQVTTSGGNITNTVNSSGFVTSTSDLYLGNSSYTYNALGALTYSKDGENNEFDYTYSDNLNRLTAIDNKNSTEGYTISYVSSGNGMGQLQQKNYTDGSLSTGISYTYDSYGRLLTEIKTIGTTRSCTLTYSYYDDGKLWKIDNSELNKTTEYIYNTKGFLTNIKYDGTTVWTLESKTLTERQEKLGSNITVTSTYDAYGNPVSTSAGSLLSLTYNFNDATGNLTSRAKGSLSETFSYDELDRLTTITGSGAGTDVGYDSSIKERMGSKSDAGDPYEYDATKKYQLDKIQNPTTTLSSLPSQAVTYTSFNKVKEITQGDYVITFWYGPNQERCKMEVKQNGSELYTKYYFGNYEIKEQGGSIVEEISYLTSPTGIIGFNSMKSGTDSTFYTICDYLGSIMVVADEDGTSKEEYSYDAWGRRRNVSNWIYSSVSSPTYITRGYTGHEHIEEVGLINMNGRVYDPLVGLFLSPDPIVQAPGNALNYNRYSYAFNNPLKYTDPSGYYLESAYRDAARRMENKGYDDSGGGGGSYYTFQWGTLGGPSSFFEHDLMIAASSDRITGGNSASWVIERANQGQYTNSSSSYGVYQSAYINSNGTTMGNGDYGVFKEGKVFSDGTYPLFSTRREAELYIQHKKYGNLAFFSLFNGSLSSLSGPLGKIDGTLRYMKNGKISLKYYQSGYGAKGKTIWGIKTVKLTSIGNTLGIATYGIGLGIDAIGLYNWYKYGDDPNHFTVAPYKGLTNQSIGLYSVLGGVPGIIVGGTYFILDNTIGIGNAVKSLDSTLKGYTAAGTTYNQVRWSLGD